MNYIERMEEELEDLTMKINKLEKYLEVEEVKNKEIKTLMKTQLKYMKGYQEVLTKRCLWTNKSVNSTQDLMRVKTKNQGYNFYSFMEFIITEDKNGEIYFGYLLTALDGSLILANDRGYAILSHDHIRKINGVIIREITALGDEQ